MFEDVTFPEPDNLFDDYEGRGTAAKEQDMTIDITMRLGGDLKVWPDEDDPGRERFTRRMDDDQRRLWAEMYDPVREEYIEAGLSGKELVSWKYQRYMRDYLACIQSVDENVGRVLDYLEESGLAENTIVIYNSDQGFYLGEHGWFDKRFMYEESLRTPLIVRWPGVTGSGQVNDDLGLAPLLDLHDRTAQGVGPIRVQASGQSKNRNRLSPLGPGNCKFLRHSVSPCRPGVDGDRTATG